MTSLTRIRLFRTTIWLLAAIAFVAACGSDASAPSAQPTPETTPASTPAPTAAPGVSPAARPTVSPTPSATAPPTAQPTSEPAASPTVSPTPSATASPTVSPTPSATASPTVSPTPSPTANPTLQPTPSPTVLPTPSHDVEGINTGYPEWSGTLSYEVVATYPHDTSAFTQGLLEYGDVLYESTGLRGQSVLRAVDLLTGNVLREVAAEPRHFGEGLSMAGNELIWLTWQAGVANVYHRDTLTPTGTFAYDGEGWGLCFDGYQFVMSDGSSTLTFRHPSTFEALSSVPVIDADGQPVEQLNELECIGNDVWANVWLTDRIVVIDPTTGTVKAEADMAGIISPHPALEDSNNVLNGIAYRPDTNTFLITGKRWPTIFEVRFESQS